MECASRYGHPAEAYLANVLGGIPGMPNQDDLGALLTARWQPAAAAAPVVEPTVAS